VDWKLVFKLSLFGLAMGLGTVFFIPPSIEPIFWLIIFLVCAYVIAKQRPAKHFLHGLFVGLVNSVWVTASHIVFFGHYIDNHPREAAMMTSMPLPDSPRLVMALMGPVVGLVSGLVIGILSWIAARILKRPQPA